MYKTQKCATIFSHTELKKDMSEKGDKTMKKGSIFFHPIEGSGPLTISWTKAPKGDATEAKKGNGVGFFSHTGDLLSVIFDDIQSDSDHQTLEFAHQG